MQSYFKHSNLFPINVSMKVDNNDYFLKCITQKNFINGLHNARNLLNDLELSLHKTNKYEKQLLKCKASHLHLHSDNEWWESDGSNEEYSNTEAVKSSSNRFESWSTMSMVCLQYQYEELAKRYKTLVQAYDERCSIVSARDAVFKRMQHRIKSAYAQLTHMHKILLCVGEKYLRLRTRKRAQKLWFENKIDNIKEIVQSMAVAAENARMELDEHLTRSMATEKDATKALLLAEIRKCNRLGLENLKLKTVLEEISPGSFAWDSQ